MKHGRRDSNHQDVVKWYRELGCTVADTADMALGLPDLFVGCAGITDPVEVKGENGDLTPLQKAFVAAWRGSAVAIVRSQDDVLAHVASMRKRAKLVSVPSKLPDDFEVKPIFRGDHR